MALSTASNSPIDAGRLRRPAGTRSLTIGDTTVTFIPDGAVTLNARMLLPEPSEEDWATNEAFLLPDGELVGSVGGLLVERAGRSLLIDAGVGPVTIGPPVNPYGVLSGGALLENLRAAGRNPTDVDAVALTHLHNDHFGWATHPDPTTGQPAFGDAEYLVSGTEWASRHALEEYGFGDAVRALAERVRTFVDGSEIFPGVTARVAAGHSAGHTVYSIETGAERIIAFGDVFHSPLQISHPLWRNAFDSDHDAAAQLRLQLVHELAAPNTIGFGIHFADVPFGRAHISQGRVQWTPVDSTPTFHD